MKKLILKNVLAIRSLFATGISFTGCSTPPLRVANSAANVQIDSVNAAMDTWGDYVRSGKATQAQVDQVHAAYDKYYSAVKVERDAMLAYQAVADPAASGDLKSKWDEAKDSLSNAINDTIAMISEFKKGAK